MLGIQPVVEVELFDQEIICFLGQRGICQTSKVFEDDKCPRKSVPLLLLCLVEKRPRTAVPGWFPEYRIAMMEKHSVGNSWLAQTRCSSLYADSPKIFRQGQVS